MSALACVDVFVHTFIGLNCVCAMPLFVYATSSHQNVYLLGANGRKWAKESDRARQQKTENWKWLTLDEQKLRMTGIMFNRWHHFIESATTKAVGRL